MKKIISSLQIVIILKIIMISYFQLNFVKCLNLQEDYFKEKDKFTKNYTLNIRFNDGEYDIIKNHSNVNQLAIKLLKISKLINGVENLDLTNKMFFNITHFEDLALIHSKDDYKINYEENIYLKNIINEMTSLDKSDNKKFLMFNLLYNLRNNICDIDDYKKAHACALLISTIANFFLENSNWELFLNYIIGDEKCLNDLQNLFSRESKAEIIRILGYSGKNLQDYGLEESCRANGYKYYFFEFQVNDTSIFNDSRFEFMFNFLEFDSYNIGICFIKTCNDFVLNFFNKSTNQQFYDYLLSYGVTKLEVYDKIPVTNYSSIFIFQLIFIAFYLFVKLICTFFYCFTRIDRKKFKDNLQNFNILSEEITDCNYPQSEIADKSIMTDKYIDLNYLNESDEVLKEKGQREKNYNYLILGKFHKIINHLYEFFSFNTNFLHLSEIKNNYYNDSKIEVISYTKSILLFLITFNHIFYTFVILPHRDFLNIKIFYSLSFGIFKITNYAIDFYISTEALTMTYKLMSHLKKNGSEFRSFLKFYKYCLPKVFIFFTIYFVFQIQFQNYGIIFGNNFTFYKILIEKFKMKECFSNDYYLIFNYYYLCYNDQDSESFSKCFKFTYLYINMFMSFNLFLIVFYFSLRLRRKIFDYTVTFSILGFLLTTFFNFNWTESKKYTFSLILGELLSFKFLHLFIIKYFMGVLAGLFFFYSREIVLNDSYINDKNYLPFEFIYSYLVYLDIKKSSKSNTILCSITHKNTILSKNNYLSSKQNNLNDGSFESYINSIPLKGKNYRKFGFILLSIVIIFFFGFYYITKVIFFSKEYEILYFTFDLKIIYYYERPLCVFAFMILITNLSLLKNLSLFKAMPESKLFLLFGRINLTYFCILDMSVYIFFTVYDIELYFSHQNVFFITLGISIIIFIMSFLLVYLFELPIRKIIKLNQ